MSTTRTATLQAAQRAFFDAALTQAADPPRPVKALAVAAAATPVRTPRPGALLDIKI